MNTTQPPKGFSTFSKFLIVFALLGATGFVVEKFVTRASTNINRTLSSQDSLNSGLAAYVPFDGKDMPNGQVDDLSINGNNGSLVGIATSTGYVEGRMGQAVLLNGTSGYIRLGTTNVAQNVSGVTISAWIKRESASAKTDPIVNINMGAGTNARYAFAIDSSNRPRILAKSTDGESSSNLTISGNPVTSANGWVHIVGIINYATNRLEIFLNGNSIGSGAGVFGATVSSNTVPAQVYIGHDGSVNFFQGEMDDVRIYNRAISNDEVRRLYQLGGTTQINKTLSSEQAIESGLVGKWTFDGRDMPAGQVNDASGNGNNGSMGNMSTSSSYVSGRLGQALNFDGVNDIVKVPDSPSLDLTTGVTLSAWVFPRSLAASNQQDRVIEKTSSYSLTLSTNDTSCDTGAGGHDVVFRTFVSGGNDFRMCFGTVPLNMWTHILGVYDNNKMSIYVNGVFASSSKLRTGTLDANANPVTVGDTNTGSRAFDGLIDDARVYNRALSPEEILRLYQLGGTTKINTTINSEPALDKDLAGYWTFDGKDMPNGLVLDRSGNSNVGSMTSMPTSTAYISGRFGQALNFDGSSGYVKLGSATNLIKNTSAASISVWVKPSSLGSGTRRFIGISQGASTGSRVSFLLSAGNLLTVIATAGDGETGSTVASTNVITGFDQWHQFATIIDFANDNVRMFVDGVEIPVSSSPSFTSTATSNTSPQVANIGTGPGTSNFWQGGLDEVRIYNRALTTAEVMELYKLGK